MNRPATSFRYIPLAAYVLLFLCSGCARRSSTSATFRWNIASGLNTLDPAQMASVASGQVGMQIFEGLVRLDTAGRVQPALAARWEIADDGRALTFFLRRGVRFQDDPCFAAAAGRIVTAADALDRMVDVSGPG